jgi:hypothetical protein
LALSLATVAVKAVVAPACTVAVLGATVTVMGRAAMVTVAVADTDGLETDVAVIVTVPPAGTVPGAV